MLPASPPVPPPPVPARLRSRYQRGVTRRSARWPAPTRRGGCCGCWRRRRCSRAAARTPCWSGSLPTTVPRRGARKVWGGATGTAWLRRPTQLQRPCPAAPCLPAGHDPLLPSDKPRHFFLGHSSGTNWVEYDATGWLNHVKHNPAAQNASVLLQESQK